MPATMVTVQYMSQDNATCKTGPNLLIGELTLVDFGQVFISADKVEFNVFKKR